MKKLIPTAAAALLALGAGVLLYLRASPAPRLAAQRGQQQAQNELYEQGQRAFGEMASVPTASIASPEAISQVLHSAFIQAPIPPDAGPREDLIAHVAEFIFHRFVQTDPAAYRQWRQASGYTILTWEELDREWRLGEDYEFHFGAVPADLTAEQAFDRLWTAAWEVKQSQVGPPIAMVSDPRGVVLCAGLYSRANPVTPRVEGDPASGGLSAGVWGGMFNAGFARWYGARLRPGSLDQTPLRRIPGSIIHADVAFVLVFQGGTRLPYTVRCCWDPDHNVWSIENLTVMNFKRGQTGPIAF